MASDTETIRIGYVPEHYLTPLHLALRSPAVASLPFKISIVPFPSGTGHMITSLREKEIDIAIGLTEGWVAGLAGKQQAQKDAALGGYKVVGEWVATPLRWAIVTGRERADLQGVADIMSFVLAQNHGWKSDSLTSVPLGPFQALRNGVTGYDPSHPEQQPEPTAEFFMWEHFTTKPYFHPTAEKPHPPLKKIGEIYTPWPSWMIVASTAVFPDPEIDGKLQQLFKLLNQGIKDFEADTAQAVKLLGTGELGCSYVEEDATEWLKDVKFVQGTRGVNRKTIEGVVDVLKVAGVIDSAMSNDEAVTRVVGVQR